jgi:hypothetical protein
LGQKSAVNPVVNVKKRINGYLNPPLMELSNWLNISKATTGGTAWIEMTIDSAAAVHRP